MQYTGVSYNPGELAVCRDCLEHMRFIYDQSLRDFCYECTERHRQELVESAMEIVRRGGR